MDDFFSVVSIIESLAVIAIAVLTFFYVLYSRQIIKEMRADRKLTFKPILKIRDYQLYYDSIYGNPKNGIPEARFKFQLLNLGQGPAILNEIVITGEQREWHTNEPKGLTVPVGKEKRTYNLSTLLQDNETKPITDNITVQLKYKDAANNIQPDYKFRCILVKNKGEITDDFISVD